MHSARPTARALLLFATLAVAALVAGCPGNLQPPGPGEGTACDTLADCNPGRACGHLLLCVDHLCEATPSLVLPCPGEGVRPSSD